MNYSEGSIFGEGLGADEAIGERVGELEDEGRLKLIEALVKETSLDAYMGGVFLLEARLGVDTDATRFNRRWLKQSREIDRLGDEGQKTLRQALDLEVSRLREQMLHSGIEVN